MGSNKKILIVALGSILSIGSAYASTVIECKKFFYKGHPPIMTNQKLSKDTMNICYSGFALSYSGVSKTALWSAEYITPQTLQKAKAVKRIDNFHEDSRVPSSKRALLSDFRGSGFDRGHLAPSANRADRLDQNQSFALTNIVAQAPKANQENWRHIEESVRTTITKNRESAYIITGPLFISKKLRKLGNGVLVPSHTYKVVFYPERQVMGAYVTVNDNVAQTDVVSVAQLQQASGLVFFPTLQGHSILKQRFNLPLSAKAAYKAKQIQPIGGQSRIFEVMPDSDSLPIITKNRSSKKEIETEIISYIDRKLPKADIVALKEELDNITKVFGQ